MCEGHCLLRRELVLEKNVAGIRREHQKNEGESSTSGNFERDARLASAWRKGMEEQHSGARECFAPRIQQRF
jgi:hypothetical protein